MRGLFGGVGGKTCKDDLQQYNTCYPREHFLCHRAAGIQGGKPCHKGHPVRQRAELGLIQRRVQGMHRESERRADDGHHQEQQPFPSGVHIPSVRQQAQQRRYHMGRM